MEAHEASLAEVQKSAERFIGVLTSAVCEWFLIFLLLIDAALSYLASKVADYCKLQTPCILCSRIDHAIWKSPGYYRNVLCNKHILELLSLISLHNHGELVDGRGMCNDCIFSLITMNMPDPKIHRILGGDSGLGKMFLGREICPGSLNTIPCSCCGEHWSPRKSEESFFEKKSLASVVHKPTVSLPSLARHSSLYDPSQLKINDESKSDFPFFDDNDDDGRRNTIFESRFSEESIAVHCASENRSIAPSSSFVSENVNNSRNLYPDLFLQHDVSNEHRVGLWAFDGVAAGRLSELNQDNAHQKPSPFTLPELIQLDDISSPSKVLVISHEVSIDDMLEFPLQEDFNSLEDCELINFDCNPILVGESSRKYVTGTDDIEHLSFNNHKEAYESSTSPTTCIEVDQVVCGPASEDPKHNDASGFCGSEGGYMNRGSSCEHDDKRDEEPKLILSLSEAFSDQGLDLSLENERHVVHDLRDELKTSRSTKSHTLWKSVSVESSLESLDMCYVSEIEGESFIDRLKRQVEHDRKCIMSLYKELEKERNASAVAANQAMAMITRLQEEKASLHMEALQYLRMMEDQAEYDVEALEKANDIIAEKEKEIQEMEAELETYRLGSPHEITQDLLARSSVETPHDEYEDERLYISQCLKSLECKILQISHSGNLSDIPRGNGGDSKKLPDDITNHEDILFDIQIEKCDSPTREDSQLCNGSSTCSHGKTNWEKSTSVLALEHEISDLNDRLEAVESSQDFVEHVLHSLHNGTEGVQFIREIARQLHELRRFSIELRRRCPIA